MLWIIFALMAASTQSYGCMWLWILVWFLDRDTNKRKDR
jgi:hypothetical protein